MACGGSIVSVYGGPADYEKYNKFFPDYNSNNIKSHQNQAFLNHIRI